MEIENHYALHHATLKTIYCASYPGLKSNVALVLVFLPALKNARNTRKRPILLIRL